MMIPCTGCRLPGLTRQGGKHTLQRPKTSTDMFPGGTANAYKTWLQSIAPENTDSSYISYIGAKVAMDFEGTGWAIGKMQCIEVHYDRKSETRVPSHVYIHAQVCEAPM